MKTFISYILFACCILINLMGQAQQKYYAASSFQLLGRAYPQETQYQRFPERLKPLLRGPVWQLSMASAGLAVLFETDSKQISAKWKTGNTISFSHVAGTLVKGVDLYGFDQGKWFYAGIGRPTQAQYQQSLLSDHMNGEMRQYLLYLPDYETADSVFIGVDSDATIRIPTIPAIVDGKPIVCYGTSIMQGASAMRPGMAYPALIERKLGKETINLGFSGNGQLDSILAIIMSEIDASIYVIDCGPNLTPQMARERTYPFIKLLHEKKSNVPILLVENLIYPTSRFNQTINKKVIEINQGFVEAYTRLKKEGIKNLYYLKADHLIGDDGEATVDGTHLTDLGFYRMSEIIGKKIGKILK